MISGSDNRPVFQYKYRPMSNDAVNGGFTVTLYGNAVLSFATFDRSFTCTDEICFSLPLNVVRYFFSLVGNAESWLAYAPQDLRLLDKCREAAYFSFDGHDPIRLWEPEYLITQPMGTVEGFYSRHVYVLFEDVANLLVEHGIEMTTRSFEWDGMKARAFRRSAPQGFDTGIRGVI